MKTRWGRGLAWSLAALMFTGLLAALLLAFALWLRMRPMVGEWTASVPLWRGGHAPRVQLSVPRLLQAATDPQLARWFDGRVVDTPAGAVRLQWQPGSETLLLRCAPCTLRLPALGDEPLRLASAELGVHRDSEWRLSGHFASGALVLPWRGQLSTKSLLLQGELAPTPVKTLALLLEPGLPELSRAEIEGTLAAAWRVTLPQGPWMVKPVVEGFTVSGLGTEALVNAELPQRCQGAGRRPPSRWLERAVIAAEDQRFYEHAGYDLDGMLASFDANQQAQAVRHGGSTLTQQLAKQLFTGDERHVSRKLRELLFAVEMERTLGKGRILQLYLALAPWGPGVCGAQQASLHYLGKPAAALTPVEAAWLASLLPHPMLAPQPVERERMALVVRSMSGSTTRQRLQWMKEAASWTPEVPEAPVQESAAAGRSGRSPHR
jgi:hypothetical protein